MSSILEALKKLEEEKAARRGMGNIAGKITKPARRSRQRPAWLVPAGMAAVAISAVLTTYGIMGGFTRDHTAPLPATSRAPASQTPAKPAPQSAAAITGTAIHQPPRQTAPEQGGKASHPLLQIPTSQARPEPETAAKQSAPARLAPQENPSELGGGSPQSSLPTLNVTGIAWQKDSAARVAVVNGTTAVEGGTIEGAKVEEIFPDRVRFSYRSKSFEVPLGK